MASVNTGGGEKKKGKQKKIELRVDFTPMVDMNMLLITFFMFCTSLSTPQTMEINMPSKDKITEEQQTEVRASNAITLLLGAEDKLYYYAGLPNYEDPNSLIETNYASDGFREVLLAKNAKVHGEMMELKKQKLNHEISDEEFRTQSIEIKKDKTAPIVMIKPSDDSSYRNLIDALDEMQICNVGVYAIVDIAEGDQFLLDLKTGKISLDSVGN
ncbi:biopolymer transporter ExbD [Bacteroidales bacterium]|nr:biopolymer transporter ExbD [Bacteroidales bacterium]